MMKTFDVTLDAGMTAAKKNPPPVANDETSLLRVLTMVTICVLAWIGWNAATGSYTPSSSFGYTLGIVGGSMLLLLLLYPLRKRVRLAKNLAPLKYWFAMHMICGIAGPLLVVFHSTFRMRSLNATVAMSCMILVAVSGVIGRFIYRKIHHGLYGARATLKEMQEALATELGSVEDAVRPIPALRQEIDRFNALVSLEPSGLPARMLHFLTLGFKRMLAQYRISRAVAQIATVDRLPSRAYLASLRRTSGNTLRAMQRVAQFSAYERLFSLWHVLHVPFVFMLVVSAIVHVVAVHMY
jgi:hypothetical protein